MGVGLKAGLGVQAAGLLAPILMSLAVEAMPIVTTYLLSHPQAAVTIAEVLGVLGVLTVEAGGPAQMLDSLQSPEGKAFVLQMLIERVLHLVGDAKTPRTGAPPEEPHDPGLATRGTRPQPGRATTRAAWRSQHGEERARTTVAEHDADGGHPHADHGYQTTEEQQTTRIRTGVSPAGRPDAGTQRATKFDGAAQEKDAIGRARARLSRDYTPTDAVRNGKTVRHVVTGFRRGYGRGWEAPTKSPPPETPITPTPQLPNAMVVFRYDASARRWKLVTAYPTDAPPTP